MRSIIKRPAVWWGLIALTMAFIWGQSLLNRAQSSEQSSSIQDILQRLFGEGVFDSFLFQNIRKVAHFSEFALLGVEWMGYRLAVDGTHRPAWWLVALAGPLTATGDELLQFITDRSPQVTDVLLDCSGYACGVLVIWGAVILCRRLRAKYSQKKC